MNFDICDGGERKSTVYQSTMCSILMLWLLFLFSTLTGKFDYTNTLRKFPPTFFQLNSIVENSIPEVRIGGREVGRIERPIEIAQKTTCLLYIFYKFSIPKCYNIQTNIICQSLTQHLFYIPWYICQGDMFRPSKSSSGPSRTQIQALFSFPALC